MVTVTEIIWILFSAVLFFHQPAFSQYQNPSSCNSVALQLSLEQGRSYEKSIGPLTLKIEAQKDVHDKDLGWYYTLVDDLDRDYIYPANLPIRYNPLQTLGAGYDLDAAGSMDWNRSARFLLSRSDYERIDPLLKQALWPVDAPDPENAGRNYINALKNTDGGFLNLKISDAEVSPGNIVRRAVLEIKFTAPAAFPFDPSLSPEITACPESMTLEPPAPDPPPQ
jgi:hypothetical protein